MLRILVIMLLVLYPCSAWQYPPCHDAQKIAEVQALADSYHFRYLWQNDTFDCVDMSIGNCNFLTAMGYDPIYALRKMDDGIGSHCYVVFPLGDGWAGLDTSHANLTEGKGRIGKVITELDMWLSFAKTSDLIRFDPRGPPIISGPVIEAN
jgi:hypothetical protein